MKSIALALLAATSIAAQAQSNVTIYGAADASFDVVTVSGASNGVNRGTFNRVESNGSYIGFKGVEDLGNGLKAIFQIEQGLALDNNQGFTGGRDTFVGLSSKDVGTVQFGTLTGPTRAAGLLVDSRLGHAGISAGSSIFGKPVGGEGTGTFDTRFGNTVAYVSPTFTGDLGSVTIIGAYVAGENKSLSNAAPADVKNTYGYDVGVSYVYGPVTTMLTHGEVRNRLDGSAPGTNLDEQKITRLVSVYGFQGGHKIGALVERTKNVYTGLASADVERTAWGLSGKYHLTQTDAIIGQFYQASNPTGNLYADNSNRKASLYEVGYEHYLSKRTVLKTSYSLISNQSNANFDYGNNPVGNGAGAGAEYKVVSAGIRHSF